MEKNFDEIAGGSQDGSSSDLEHIEVDWTEEEEAKLIRKVDFTIMPLLVLGFFALQLDRGNIGNALTDFFMADVGITQSQFNVGQQLLSAGIVLLEIPSNFILYRVGPAKWIGSQIIAWGLVATFQAFQKGLGAFLSTRLLLGLCEAGFIPAGLYTITRWYKRDETSKRFSIYFLGNMLASGASGLIAYGILHMRGIGGLGGWQWLFILEGIFTILVGILFILFFPDSPFNPVSLFKFGVFTEREKEILTKRILKDDPSKIHAKPNVTQEEFRNVMTNWRLIPHVLLTISALAPATTMSSYSPSLVKSFGDKLQMRGPLVAFGIFMFWAFTIADRVMVFSPDGHTRFALLTLTHAFGWQWHPLNGSWMALNAGSAGERSITMAILIMSANTSGIIGSQLFQEHDAPLYKTGWTAIMALASVGLVMAVIANLQYFFLNGRRIGRKGLKYSP
ncbi:nicotinamide mononucleotide permease [Fusarium tjaetaba]|uniref:Nicotinamide mononucleotide permease n=1 Tax=Fusarium tjaetaba TaxID=1567544 RepID=A0A8H5VKR5_9HYPO|nr:nicotinamide mononucleotide permease [Fusarium tjaetaba]KAF5625865.1 nicotinamide mononucleotide permease [Fusarium tjaetaba]